MARKLGPTEYYKTELKTAVTDDDGFKYSQDGKRLFKAPGQLKQCIIRNGVEAICDEAFSGRVSYEDIYLPDSVKHIGRHAFYGCYRLERIRIPDGVDFGTNAFKGCTSLPDNYLPASYQETPEADSVSQYQPRTNNRNNQVKQRGTLELFFFDSCVGCVFWIIVLIALWYCVCKYVF